ncbi:RICIN domain-containing protein [Tahibacter sp.]|uniref:RICIN domain-containing protein n=1 Tax=Tahibacter sp. TaxID=2056211 RepID=UPI0028C3F57F|nr:RICIN domain-containing protein [Tahibacter sp.]
MTTHRLQQPQGKVASENPGSTRAVGGPRQERSLGKQLLYFAFFRHLNPYSLVLRTGAPRSMGFLRNRRDASMTEASVARAPLYPMWGCGQLTTQRMRHRGMREFVCLRRFLGLGRAIGPAMAGHDRRRPALLRISRTAHPPDFAERSMNANDTPPASSSLTGTSLSSPTADAVSSEFPQQFAYRDTPYVTTVPADMEQVVISIAGGYGGYGSGNSGGPGHGSRISAIVPVVPGEQLTITVGGAAHGVHPGTGFRPGGSGGKGGNDPGANGGGGGGSSAVVGSVSGLLIHAAGGGGAGGQGDLGLDGGDGGSGGTGAAGGNGAALRPLGHGGRGGAGGDPRLTAQGGSGESANSTSTSGGGGGGGGGAHCGDGGGAGSPGGGGGGGGGSSYVSSTAGNISAGTTDGGNGHVTLFTTRNLYRIVSALSGQVIAVAGASEQTATPLIQYPYSGDSSQQWQLVWIGDSRTRCRLVSLLSGQVIAVASASTQQGARLIQYPYTGDTSQQWDVVPVSSNRAKLVSVHSTQVIAVASASQHPGAPLIQYPYTGDNSQQWELVALDRS